jgi:hypothetical protein
MAYRGIAPIITASGKCSPALAQSSRQQSSRLQSSCWCDDRNAFESLGFHQNAHDVGARIKRASTTAPTWPTAAPAPIGPP